MRSASPATRNPPLEAGGAGVLAQDRKTERMKGVDRRPIGVVRKQAREPLCHLGGGAAGERDGEAVFAPLRRVRRPDGRSDR